MVNEPWATAGMATCLTVDPVVDSEVQKRRKG